MDDERRPRKPRAAKAPNVVPDPDLVANVQALTTMVRAAEQEAAAATERATNVERLLAATPTRDELRTLVAWAAGVAVAVLLVLLIWAVAWSARSATAQMDGRLRAVEQRMTGVEDAVDALTPPPLVGDPATTTTTPLTTTPPRRGGAQP